LKTDLANFTAPQSSRLRRFLREPLLHFLLIGAALFAIYHRLNPNVTNTDSSHRIVLTNDDLHQLEITWMAQWRRPPTEDEMRRLIEDNVREEVLYREALALGFDRGDTIVRRRMAQKMEFLSDDVSALREPTLDELKSWYAQNGSIFSHAARISFRHIYFSPDKRGSQAQTAAESAFQKIANKGDATEQVPSGDRFMFQDYYRDSTADQVANIFGNQFADAVLKIEPGAWSDPIASGYGWHLVWVDSITPRRVPQFEEVDLAQIKSQWMSAQRIETKRDLFKAMRARYQVVLPGSAKADSVGR
jgi:peptidyl-prolyl cis-trans isomerase C